MKSLKSIFNKFLEMSVCKCLKSSDREEPEIHPFLELYAYLSDKVLYIRNSSFLLTKFLDWKLSFRYPLDSSKYTMFLQASNLLCFRKLGLLLLATIFHLRYFSQEFFRSDGNSISFPQILFYILTSLPFLCYLQLFLIAVLPSYLKFISLSEEIFLFGSFLSNNLLTLILCLNNFILLPSQLNGSIHQSICITNEDHWLFIEDIIFDSVLVLPIMHFLLNNARWELLLSTWLGSNVLNIISLLSIGSWKSALMLCIVCYFSSVMIFDRRLERVTHFVEKTFPNVNVDSFSSKNKKSEPPSPNASGKEKPMDLESQELQRIMANTAHDLKTPVATISNATEFMSCLIDEVEDYFIIYQNSIPSPPEKAMDDLKKTLGDVRNTTSFMLVTINRFLDLTKVSHGLQLVPRLETINIEDTLNQALTYIGVTSTKTPVIIDPIPHNVYPDIITDKQWLQENIICYLSNAIKFSSGDPIHIRIRLKRRGDFDSNGISDSEIPKSLLTFEVEDHGIGISKESQVSLFEAFHQAQKLAGGTGLGLFSLSKRLTALKGEFGVTDRRDGTRGSLFWFAFPYKPDKSFEELVPSPRVRSRSMVSLIHGHPSSGSLNHLLSQGDFQTLKPEALDERFARSRNTSVDIKADNIVGPVLISPSQSSTFPFSTDSNECPLRVLIVDDTETIVKIVTRILQKNKFEVASAYNGVEALDLLEDDEEGFDVVLMDLQMPKMDGLEATKRIRLNEKSKYESNVTSVYPLIIDTGSDCNTNYVWKRRRQAMRNVDENFVSRQYVIGCSADSGVDTITALKSAGMDDFIDKPFNINQFIRLIQHKFGLSIMNFNNFNQPSTSSTGPPPKPPTLINTNNSIA